jgi:ubiquinol-cytochrome c reductase cytochrome c1 subunit
MMNMKKLFARLGLGLAFVFSHYAMAAGGALVHIEQAPYKQNDHASLQNGARIFMNYCSGCHSAAYMRYNRLKDIGITEDQIKASLLFTTDKVGDSMKNAMDAKNAKDWFGGVPPDLTLIARSRAGEGYNGADYLYTLLRSYYRDDTKASGWNNLVYPNIAMPHPLWELQGQRGAEFEKVTHHGETHDEFKAYETLTPGSQNAAEYDKTVSDVVGFLQWMGEPAQSQRTRLGVWVLIFIGFFTFLAWRLNAAYWKDIK